MSVRFAEKVITFLFDLLAVNVAFFTAYWIRFSSGLFVNESGGIPAAAFTYLEPSLMLSVVWIVMFFLTGLYRDWNKESRLDEFFVVARTVCTGIFLFFLVTSAPQIMEFTQTGDIRKFLTPTKFATILTYGGCMLFFASANRFAMHTLTGILFSKGIAVSKVLVVGANRSGEKLVRDINSFPKLGYRVAGFIDDDGSRKGSVCGGLPIFGTYSDIPSVAQREKIGGLIIGHVSGSANEISRVLNYCGELHINIYMVPSLMDVISGHQKTHQLFGVPLMVLLQDHMPGWEAQVKRIIDIAVSFLVLLLGAPVWLAVGGLIRLTSAGPAIYKQERVGRNGKNYTMYKFRSMYSDAESRSGPQWASENDPRITPIGRFIRKTRLDEIPQFINVLKGEMSLVGPRPERPFFVEQLKQEIPWYVRRIKMKPGITGWAQVKHKYDSSIEDVKQKVLYDLYYFENMSLSLDLKILVRTILVVLTGKGAH
ncbi:MAG: sugar transferase [Chitinispirillales bacterium]|jgi:exopolysaccharide biosynthesis polyprenyl glycosylphosphotransferase|nr:sugar transferase [Chitinispirillales bacterium]